MLDPKVIRVGPEPPEIPVQEENPVLQDRKESRVILERLVTPEIKDHPESKEIEVMMDLMDKKAGLVTLDP